MKLKDILTFIFVIILLIITSLIINSTDEEIVKDFSQNIINKIEKQNNKISQFEYKKILKQLNCKDNICNYKNKQLLIENNSKFNLEFRFKTHNKNYKQEIRTCFIKNSKDFNIFIFGCEGINPDTEENKKFQNLLKNMNQFIIKTNRYPDILEINTIISKINKDKPISMKGRNYHLGDYSSKCENKDHYIVSLNGHSMEYKLKSIFNIDIKLNKSHCFLTIENNKFDHYCITYKNSWFRQ